VESQKKHMRAYLGYVASFHTKVNQGLSEVNLSVNISSYANPVFLADFVSYLRARDVGKGHILLHLALARKVNDFIKSANEASKDAVDFLERLDLWIGKVEKQVNSVMPKRSQPKDTPDAKIMYSWATDRMAMAMKKIESWNPNDLIQLKEATFLHDSLLIALVTGTYLPPMRLNTIMTWNHPRYKHCTDKDCRAKKGSCFGNRLVPFNSETGETFDDFSDAFSWASEDNEEEISLESDDSEASHEDQEQEMWASGSAGHSESHGGGGVRKPPVFDSIECTVVHDKNDRRPSACPVQFSFPEGPLTDLLLTYIFVGYDVRRSFTRQKNHRVTELFFSSEGKAFYNSSFTQYWEKIMKSCPVAEEKGIKYFAPSAARTTYADDSTAAFGIPKEHLEGAATIMGHSMRQHLSERSYNPYKRSKQAQAALPQHTEYVERALKRLKKQ
jgi:hypothetical protein